VSSARRAALEMLRAVVRERRSLDAAAPRATAALASPRDRALARELGFGVLRWLTSLDTAMGMLLDRPLEARDPDLRLVLALGLYQILHLRVPAHAAVSETVALAREAGMAPATGLVNAVLRRALRERDDLQVRLARDDQARHAHPEWLIERLRTTWPESWEAILTANNERAPMTLRVNVARTTRARARSELADAGITAHDTRWSECGLVLDTPQDVHTLPGFVDGRVSVQDEAAQLAAQLLAASAGQRVLDACAAPGGKSGHLLERSRGSIGLTAVERAPARAEQLRQGLARIGLPARVIQADAARPEQWWDGQPFDRILLDAPCSATGVIRRHPDIKHLRRPGDPERLAARQLELLRALWSLLNPGGRLLYATCSVLQEENDLVVERFLADCVDARPEELRAPWGSGTRFGRQILPGEDAMDGFYYAALIRDA
jgi:16S rRNA (cytosine967-C5)-methyltransferase